MQRDSTIKKFRLRVRAENYNEAMTNRCLIHIFKKTARRLHRQNRRCGTERQSALMSKTSHGEKKERDEKQYLN